MVYCLRPIIVRRGNIVSPCNLNPVPKPATALSLKKAKNASREILEPLHTEVDPLKSIAKLILIHFFRCMHA